MYISDIKDNQLIIKPQKKFTDGKRLLRFPLVKHNISIEQLANIYNKLKLCKDVIVDGKIVLVGYEYFNLIDYFQEKVRMGCRRYNQKYTPLEKFEYHKNQFKKPYTYKNVMDQIFKFKLCSELDPHIVITIINSREILGQKIEIKRFLDMSIGRGSQLMACMMKDIEYVGTDPCEAAFPHTQMIEKYCRYMGSTSAVQLFKCGFETNWPWDGRKFDVMFSSPPYFDVEIYEDNETQSIAKNKTVDEWLDNFLFVCMNKIITMIHSGGLIMMNIDNPTNGHYDYVGPLIKKKFEGADYIGSIFIRKGFNIHTWKVN